MNRTRPTKILLSSVLDRLTGDPSQEHDRRGISVWEMKQVVQRDLEKLLNSRKCPDHELLDGCEEAQRSIMAYGLPDFSSFSRNDPNDLREICDHIRQAIRDFEPRLVARTVRVEFIEAGEEDLLRFHFRIQASLRLEPIPEPVSFDTVFHHDTGSFKIESII